jgi:hypothetical protein
MISPDHWSKSTELFRWIAKRERERKKMFHKGVCSALKPISSLVI